MQQPPARVREPPPTMEPSPRRFSREAMFAGIFVGASLLAVASTVQLALASEGAKRGRPFHTWIQHSYFTEPKNETLSMGSYPAGLFIPQDKIKLSSAAASLVLAVLVGTAACYASIRGLIKTYYAWRLALVVGLGLNAVWSLAAALYVLISHQTSDHFDIDLALAGALRSGENLYPGTFDLETWACETKDLPNFDREHKLHEACGIERGGRLMTIFLFVFASLLFGVVFLDRRSGSVLVTSWKGRRQSWKNDYL